jgi:serine protease Do
MRRVNLFILTILFTFLFASTGVAAELAEGVGVKEVKATSTWSSVVEGAQKTKTQITPVLGAPKSFNELVKNVSPAVVNISTTKKIRMQPYGHYGFGPRYGPKDSFDDFFEKFYGGVPERQREQRSLGSGFIMNAEGFILTNNHVVAGADEVMVRLSDEHKFKAKIIGRDEETDLAVIKIDSDSALPFANLGDSDSLQIGDWVVAIGNPFGLSQTVTAGIVSAKGRIIGAGPYDNFIQTDASINPGNSGGPLFDMHGNVVGINTAIFAFGQGLGFAIPINMAKKLVPQLVEHGKVKDRGWLGVMIQEITPELAKSFGLPDDQIGALIGDVVPGSPAAKSGLKRGDVVVAFNSKEVKHATQLPGLVATMQPGVEANLTIIRGGKKQELKVSLGRKEEALRQPIDKPKGTADKLGLVVGNLSPEAAHKRGLVSNKGVLVSRVEPDSVAENGDVRSGDVVVQINNTEIDGVGTYQKAVEALKKGDVVRLLIRRKGGTIYLAFKLI